MRLPTQPLDDLTPVFSVAIGGSDPHLLLFLWPGSILRDTAKRLLMKSAATWTLAPPRLRRLAPLNDDELGKGAIQ